MAKEIMQTPDSPVHILFLSTYDQAPSNTTCTTPFKIFRGPISYRFAQIESSLPLRLTSFLSFPRNSDIAHGPTILGNSCRIGINDKVLELQSQYEFWRYGISCISFLFFIFQALFFMNIDRYKSDYS